MKLKIEIDVSKFIETMKEMGVKFDEETGGIEGWSGCFIDALDDQTNVETILFEKFKEADEWERKRKS